MFELETVCLFISLCLRLLQWHIFLSILNILYTVHTPFICWSSAIFPLCAAGTSISTDCYWFTIWLSFRTHHRWKCNFFFIQTITIYVHKSPRKATSRYFARFPTYGRKRRLWPETFRYEPIPSVFHARLILNSKIKYCTYRLFVFELVSCRDWAFVTPHRRRVTFIVIMFFYGFRLSSDKRTPLPPPKGSHFVRVNLHWYIYTKHWRWSRVRWWLIETLTS